MSSNNSSEVLATLVGVLITFWITLISWNSKSWMGPVWERLDYLIYDLRFKSLLEYQQQKPKNKIIIIDIDEKSLREVGRWPWSRPVIAALLENAYGEGVVMVGFDVVFAEPELNPVHQLITSSRINPDVRESLQPLAQLFDPDLGLAGKLGSDTILGYFFQGTTGAGSGTNSGSLPAPLISAQGQYKGVPLNVRLMTGYSGNLEVLQQNALGAGSLTTLPDSDGVIRRIPLLVRYGQGLYPTLALEMARHFWFVEQVRLDTALVNGTEIIEAVYLDKYRIPTDEYGQVLVPFVGPARSFPYISATDIIHRPQQISPDLLQGAIAFVGASALGIGDLRTTVMGPGYPGVEVHANLLNGILNTQDENTHFAYRPDYASDLTVLILLTLGLILAWWLPRLSPWNLLAASCLVLMALVGMNFYGWYQFRIDLPLSPAIALWFCLSFLNFADGFVKENTQRRQLKRMFGQYVPSQHIDQMLGSKNEYTFEGRSKEMTVMFSDIRSFTTISEGLNAQELKDMLNKFFTPITEIIFRHKGTIDKYVGDMVMAFWGAPLEDEAHADHAIAAGLEMLAMVEKLKPEFKTLGLPQIEIGIGVNTGTMHVGDMGSTYRRAYTVLGDAVNLGSRLEGVTKYYGAKLLVGELTQKQAQQYLYRLVDCIRVKGKSEPVKVYEPICKLDTATPEQCEAVQAYHEGLQFYYDQCWDKARSVMEGLRQSQPEVKIYQVYLERIERLAQRGAGENWDGVFTHTSK